MRTLSTWFTFFISCALCVQSARILLVFTLPEKSHYILGNSLARALAETGHDITMLSPFAEKVPPKGGSYRDIQLTGTYEETQEKHKNNELNFFDLEGCNPFWNAFDLAMTTHSIASTFEHKNFKKLINSKEKFDVVIVEQFVNDAFKALSTHFDAPLVVFSSLGANFWVNPLVGNPSPTSYIPDIMLKYFGEMTFFERLVNSLVYIFNELLYNFYVFPIQNKIIEKYIPNGPDISDVLYNASIVLLNSHPSTNQPVPLVPNMIDIGGFHIQPPKKLPPDLQEFLDQAQDGVIYFSMGSNARSAQFPPEKINAFLKTFSKLKEKVLWKWEEDNFPGQTGNIKTGKWLPQQDILAHPNVKLFITHGGLLSTTEAVYHGVPILAIPVFGDQKINAKLAVRSGYGLLVPYDKISEDLLSESIYEILNNPKYKKNAKARSKIFHDRLVSPMETAIYWVEYVIRHRGAPHLKVAAVDMPWYKYHLLDVITVVVGFSLVSLLTLRLIFKKMCCRTIQKNKSKKKTC